MPVRLSLRTSTNERWIQKAIKRPGSLKAWLKKHSKEIAGKYKESPFTEDGKIKLSVLKKLKRDVPFLKKISRSKWKLVRKKINLAITLKTLRR